MNENDSTDAIENEDGSRRGDVIAIAILAAIVTLFFADVLFGTSRFYTRDLAMYYLPMKAVIREIVLAGEFPWWNPYYSGGQPLAANPEYEIFYPPHWLILLPSFELGYKLHILAHVYLTTISSFILFRSLRLGIPVAMFGAISWGLGGTMISMISLLPILFAAAWIPLIFLLARRVLNRFRWSDAAWFALVAGLQILVGEPTTLIQTWLVLGAYALWTMWSRSREGLPAWRVPVILLVLFIWSVAIGLVQLAPAIDHARDTDRAGGLPYESVMGWSFPPVRALELAHPFLFGHLSDDGRTAWWGRTLYEQRQSPFILRIYAGALLVPLFIAGLWSCARERIPLILLITPFALVAFGWHTPLMPWLHTIGFPIPFRFPEKFMLTVLFAVVLFCSVVLDRIFQGDRAVQMRALIIAGTLSCLFAIIAIFARTEAYSSLFLELWSTEPSRFADRIVMLSRRGWILALLTTGSYTAALLAIRLRPSSRRLWEVAILAVLSLELLSVHYDTIPRIESEFYEPPAVVDELDPDRDGYRIFHQMDWYESGEHGEGYNRLGKGSIWAARNSMSRILPLAWGFRTILEEDYDLTHVQPTSELVRSMWEVQSSGQQRWAEFFLPISNVRYVAVARPLQQELRRVDGRLWEIQPADFVRVPHLPRYYFASRIEHIVDREQFVQEIQASIPETRTAFTDLAPFDPGRGRILAVDETSSSVDLRVTADSKAFLVLSQTYHDYWKATLYGAPASLHRVNIGYQGIVVPPGEHEIRLVYRNPVIMASAPVSILALLAAIVVVLWNRATRPARS